MKQSLTPILALTPKLGTGIMSASPAQRRSRSGEELFPTQKSVCLKDDSRTPFVFDLRLKDYVSCFCFGIGEIRTRMFGSHSA